MAELVSTRALNPEPISYNDAVLAGLAPDRGLYMPAGAEYPTFEKHALEAAADYPYSLLATTIKYKLIGSEIHPNEQRRALEEVYDPAKFPGLGDNIAPVVPIGDNLYAQNLSQGPTAAFKDFGLGSVAVDIDSALRQRGQSLRILAATSGDTWPAAQYAFRDIGSTTLFGLSSLHGATTPFQRAQMGVLSTDRIHNLRYDGSFDDCQDMVKDIKTDPEFQDIGAVNSINWGRVVAQVVYYVDGYLQITGGKVGEPVDFVVPTGNFGNILSGHIAKRMGLPIRNLIAATNENDVMHRLIQTGEYDSPVKQHDTSSPSMDITKASNYERLVYEFFEGDGERTKAYMQEFEATGRVSLKDHGLSPRSFQAIGMSSGVSRHANRLASIEQVYKDSGQVIDPHTADAVAVANNLPQLEVPTVCLATASPVKFEATVAEALGNVPAREVRFVGLEDHPRANAYTLIASLDDLKAYIRSSS